MKLAIFTMVVLFWVGAVFIQIDADATPRHALAGLYEPSGLAMLADGRILVVEDEMLSPLSVLRPDDVMAALPFASKPEPVSGPPDALRLDDLEAATSDADGHVFMITSHSRTNHGNRFKSREKLVRFRLDGNEIVDAAIITNLRDQITELTRDLAKAGRRGRGRHGLNIEGMAYDPAGNRLLIGLRQPVVNGQAVLLPLPEPDREFSNDPPSPLLGEPVYLDLAGGGIRAMAYSPALGGFLIMSRQEKHGEAFKLWFWNPHDGDPRQIRLAPEINLKNAEGLAVVRQNGSERIMLVFDNGNRKHNHAAAYLMLTHEQILAGLGR